MGRKQNDVFVLGEEVLLAAPVATADPDPVAARDDRQPDGETSAPAPARPLAQVLAPRRLAVLGLGAAAAATLAALEFSNAAHRQPSQTSASSPLSAGSAARDQAPPTDPAPPASTVPKPEPRHRHRAPRRPARDSRRGEPKRKPTPEKAPLGSAVEAPAPPVRSAAGPAPATPPPSPSPPPGGDGQGGRENFGFER